MYCELSVCPFDDKLFIEELILFFYSSFYFLYPSTNLLQPYHQIDWDFDSSSLFWSVSVFWGIFLVLVLLSAHDQRFSVSRKRDFLKFFSSLNLSAGWVFKSVYVSICLSPFLDSEMVWNGELWSDVDGWDDDHDNEDEENNNNWFVLLLSIKLIWSFLIAHDLTWKKTECCSVHIIKLSYLYFC